MNSINKSIPAVIRNLPAPIATLAVSLFGFSTEWAAVIGGATGLLAVYHELAEKRGKELLEYVETHREEFAEEIINTETFKATFINVWEMHIRENDAEKRKRLRHFLLNLGKGEDIPDDTHTKIYNIIEQMTEKEAFVFGAIIRDSGSGRIRRMNLSSTSIPELNSE